jgi:hypothetical protein
MVYMISEKFVKIAREVIKYIKSGGKLGFNKLLKSYEDDYTCPLGAVCVNHGLNIIDPTDNYIKSDNFYKFSSERIGLENDGENFFRGFDNSLRYDHCWSNNEDYIIGFNLGKMCKKRNWIS